MCNSCGLECSHSENSEMMNVSSAGCRDCQNSLCSSCLENSVNHSFSGSNLTGAVPVDTSSGMREDGMAALDTGQGHLRDNFDYKDIDIQSDMRTGSTGSDVDIVTEDNQAEGHYGSMKAAYDSDGVETSILSNNTSFSPKAETNMFIWTPPEPEDMEDEMDSIANYDDDDDDDDYSDGTKWGQPTSLSSFNEENGNSQSYKEDRRKAMMDAMNGQFKILVSRFLTSDDLDNSWLDMVASLSWEAASLIKPEANEGRAMDPSSYVKVKCIASGAPTESQVIKGLVFKKSTAHKHMPTRFQNPRLLLLRGALGNSSASLSSFDSMEWEENYLKAIIDMIETCHPNVVFVERTVSRVIQESLLKKGITLVFDMKLPRLEKIARCTGSQIISCDDIDMKPKLKQCDYFHIEKVMEEHNTSGEGAKRPSKTLMFVEGCPRPLGCTILLKGAQSDELKKVKRVIYYTVFAAYHLILETSFFADQRSFFSDVDILNEGKNPRMDETLPSSVCSNIPISTDASAFGSTSEFVTLISDAPQTISAAQGDGYTASDHLKASSTSFGAEEPQKPNSANGYYTNSSLLPGHFLSSFSNFIGNNFPSLNSQSISSFLSFEDNEFDSHSTSDVPVSPSNGRFHHNLEDFQKIDEKQDLSVANGEKGGLEQILYEEVENCHVNGNNVLKITAKDDIEGVLDTQCILILISSQCIAKGVVCEQSHLSRIKYYGNFDLSLGRYLQDTLLNKKHHCSSCGEPPEAHIYSFTHRNGSLTVLVRQLPLNLCLPGEAEGKIWMWTRCLKCTREKGVPQSTRRVVMSKSARGLSFGKFLELSFSSNCAASKLSKCGHLLHRDCLRFFGLGSKVAMFRYSALEIYAACKPPPVLEFSNPSGQEWQKREIREVLTKANHIFSEVANLLQKLKVKSRSLSKHLQKVSGAIKGLNEIEEMLMHERTEFEACLRTAINHAGQTGKSFREILDLTWMKQELLLELYVWDRRLHFLLMSPEDENVTDDIENIGIQEKEKEKDTSIKKSDNSTEFTHQTSIGEVDSYAEGYHNQTTETVTDIEIVETSNKFCRESCLSGSTDLATEEDHINLQRDKKTGPRVQELETDGAVLNDDISTLTVVNNKLLFAKKLQELNTIEDPERWIWTPFAELRRTYRKDLSGGYLQRFGFIHSYKPSYLSPLSQMISEEINSLHFPVGSGGNIMSVCDDEVSSIIACALAMSESQSGLLESSCEKDLENDRTIEKSDSISSSEGSVAPSNWSSTGSFEFDLTHLSQSLSSLSYYELSTPTTEGSFFLDRLVSSESSHPEVHVGVSKLAGKSKYSVVCIHAKEFYDLRKRCCPSELAYISSLRHCKKWDAQGGKSKAVFAKSMDDRFIIKSIKRTEVDSFLRFAPDYFRHVNTSLDSGSQTCLAKILGIYQVRKNKGGKEVRADLMVMENLLYGHNILRKYDLKGALFSRYVPDANDPDACLLDENFVEDMRISPIYIGGRTKHLLQRAIWNDTAFLTSINVMDYSLLVGIDKERHELVFGIIDYLRQYTWDKQLETWVKSSLVVPKNESPTVVSPREYKKRFRKFMTKYFLTVPDDWTSEPDFCNPCNFCVDGSSGSSNLHNGRPTELVSQA